jgi:hypothetical protein
MLETEIDGYGLDAGVRLAESALCVLDAPAIPELVRSCLEFLAKKANEMIGADGNLGSNCIKG